MPAASAFEAVLDQKLDDVATWADLRPRPVSAGTTLTDPALRAALWKGAMPNPLGLRAFATYALGTSSRAPQPSRPAVSDARPASPERPLVEPVRTQPAVSRTARVVRPSAVVRIENMQQRLALAEFAEAGVPPDARDVPLEALRDAYRRMARAYHPDRHPSDSEAARAGHAARFVRVAAAYRILTGA